MNNKVDGLAHNQFIQASYHILSVLEKAKANVETMLDELPSVFLVVDVEGRIIRGNAKASEIFEVDLDELLGLRLDRLFTSATWTMFHNHLSNCSGDGVAVAFELPMDRLSSSPIMSWNVRPIQAQNDSLGICFSVFGADVTAVREYERQLAHIFTSIPLGIIRLDENLSIVPPASRFTEYLLGTTDLNGKNIFDVLFNPAWEMMSLQQREQANNLRQIVGCPSIDFDLAKHLFVKLIHIPHPSGGEGKWLGISYEPIVHAHKITGILLVLEDRTHLEKVRAENEVKRQEEDGIVRRFLELRRLNSKLRDLVLRDLAFCFSTIQQRSNDRKLVLHAVHSIKSMASDADIQTLKNLSLRMEGLLGGPSPAREWLNDFTRPCVEALEEEWAELQYIAKALGHEPALTLSRSLPPGTVELSQLEPRLQVALLMAAQRNGKSVQLRTDWSGSSADEETATGLVDTLMLLLDGILADEFDPPTVQSESQMVPERTLFLTARVVHDIIMVTLEDDGGLLESGQSAGPSTLLAAARVAVKPYNGSVSLEPRAPRGSSFKIEINQASNLTRKDK